MNNQPVSGQKRKICFVTAVPQSATTFLKGPINALANHFDVYYAGNFSDHSQLEGLQLKDSFKIPIERKPSLKTDFKAFCALYKLFRKENFFAVHAITPKASLLTSSASYCARVPHRIKTYTGQVWATMHGVKRFVFRLFDKIDALLDNHLLVDGNSQMDFLRREGVLKTHQGEVLAEGSIAGIDTDRFHPSEHIRTENRKRLGYSDSDIVLVFLGRLCRDKGIYELLQAFNDITKQHPAIKLLLVGNDEDGFKSKINDYPNLTEGTNIIYYGPTPTPESLLQAADIFVSPTYREGFGVAVLEASCLGLPVICSDTYGVADAFIEAETGLKCKVKDVDSLKEAVLTLCASQTMRRQLGENGRKRVLEKFTQRRLNNAWTDFYLSLK